MSLILLPLLLHIRDRVRMLRKQVSIPTDLHVLCQTTNAPIQKLKADGRIARSERVDLELVALPQLPLLDLLLRQIPASKSICDRVRMVRNQMSIPTHASLLHPLTSPRIHILKAQLVSAPRVRVVLSRRKVDSKTPPTASNAAGWARTPRRTAGPAATSGRETGRFGGSRSS